MSQSRMESMIETAASTAIGFVVAWVSTMLILPLFGLPVTPSKGLGITTFFTIVSLVRGYFVRRLFNQLHARKASA